MKILQSRPVSPSQSLAVTVGRNTFFGIVASLTQVGTRFITVPIVIEHLGLDGYGIWSVIMSIAMCMRFGSAGIKSAFQKYVAEATGKGEFENVNKLLSTGTAGVLIFSVVTLAPVAVFSHYLAQIIGVTEEFLDETAKSITVLAVMMIFLNAAAVYEAIVMGAHRIDVAKKLGSIATIFEGIGIVLVLHFGYGLFGMSMIIALSEAGFLFFCVFLSRRLLPALQVTTRHCSRTAFRELFVFAGSYQIVGILEVLYVTILPVTVLKWFGGDAAGIFAIANRLVSAAMLAQEAFLLPMLSGASLVYASGSVEKMLVLLTKSFKATLIMTMLPLAFIACQGTLIIFIWTGQADTTLPVALWLICLATFFKSISLFALVLYRASGKALMDIIRQVLRIVALCLMIPFGHQIGFYGLLGGWVVAECIGMFFMLMTMTTTFHGLRVKLLLPDTARLTAATLIIIAAGLAVASLSELSSTSERLKATIQLGEVSVLTFIAALLALILTRSVSLSEVRTILQPHTTDS
jgi:O-antigen/teichoic acid export membrane protein